MVLKIKQSVVRVAAKKAEGTVLGSGFLAAAGPYHGYAVTCRHCVEGCEPSKICVAFSDGKEWPVYQVRTNPSSDKDVALLSLSHPSEAKWTWGAKQDVEYPPLELGSWSEVDEGEEVLFCGYPTGMRFALTHRAMVSAKAEVKPNVDGPTTRYIWLDGSINFGNSGGPVVSLESQRVVGVISNRAGGLSDHLLESIRFLRAFPGVGLAYTTGGKTVDFVKVIAQSLESLHSLGNMGIGTAVEIDAAKELLYEVSG